MEFVNERLLNNYDFNQIMGDIMGFLKAGRLIVRIPVHEESEIFKTVYDSRGEIFEEKRDVVSAYYISNEKAELIRDFSNDIFKNSELLQEGIRALFIMPLRFSGKTIGMMILIFTDVPKMELLSKLEEYQPILGLLLSYRIKEMELSESVLVDRLTNLPSAPYFWQRVDEEYKRAKRYSRKFSIILVDIDNLEDINKKYGPRTTDKLLRKFAQLMKAHFRSTDIVARFGGDEFAVILPETGLQNIYQVSEGFRLKVMSTPFEIEFGPVLNITVTIAAINYPSFPLDPDALVDRLLAALGEGKKDGGNRTILINY